MQVMTRCIAAAMILCCFLLCLPLLAEQPLFDNTALLQKAAAPILPAVGWKNLGEGLGFYGSGQMTLPPTGFVESTLTYSISGNSRTHVEKVLFSVFIASPTDLIKGRQLLEQAFTQWAKTVNLPVPTGLGTAIKTGKAYKGAAASGAVIDYVLERCPSSPGIKQPDGSLYRCTTMDLTIKPR